VNRRWAFILALGVSLVLCSFIHPRAFAADGTGSGKVGDPYDVPPGQDGTGDPDVPIGPMKGANAGRLSRGSSNLATRTAGDGRITGSVLVWRLRVVLQGLRSYYIRF
jgi:hypothetical protein